MDFGDSMNGQIFWFLVAAPFTTIWTFEKCHGHKSSGQDLGLATMTGKSWMIQIALELTLVQFLDKLCGIASTERSDNEKEVISKTYSNMLSLLQKSSE